MSNIKKIHFNKPQIRSMSIKAHEEYAVWGRGTGKSEGLIAPRTLHNIFTMPRSNGVYVASTFQQLLTRTLPGVLAGWNRMGYKEGVHFTINKPFSRGFNVPKSYAHPLSHKHYIHWFNGSGIYMVSQDRVGSSNGLSVDWIIGDEAKLLNKKKLDEELMPTNRGNRQYFKHLPEHHSLLFCTDMPTTPASKWILDKETEVDHKTIDLIYKIQCKIYEIQNAQLTAGVKLKLQLQAKINKLHKAAQNLRMNTVFFSQASALENIDILGKDYIMQLKRNLPDLIFRSSVLNERLNQIEHGFYPNLNEEVHGYFSYNNSFLESLDYNMKKIEHSNNCQQDSDLEPGILDIAFDYGAHINTLVVGQEQLPYYRFLNALFVKSPQLITDLVNKFIEYYRFHSVKEVRYYYDHTAIATDAGRSEPYSSMVIDTLRKAGWKVRKIYCGQAPTHQAKYIEWSKALRDYGGSDHYLRFNRGNCKYLLISMQQAELKQGRNNFQKNKKDERNLNLNQAETTHFSDAVDSLFYFRCHKKLGLSGSFVAHSM